MIKKEPLAGYRDLLSVDDLCAIFEVSRQTIYKEIRRGKFGETVQIGREYKSAQDIRPAAFL